MTPVHTCKETPAAALPLLPAKEDSYMRIRQHDAPCAIFIHLQFHELSLRGSHMPGWHNHGSSCGPLHPDQARCTALLLLVVYLARLDALDPVDESA